MNSIIVEIHRAKEVIVWLKEIREILPKIKMNDGIKLYLSNRVEDSISVLREAKIVE